MLQVYDRVLPSRSVSTLLALGAFVVILMFAQGLIDMIRGRIRTRVASDLDEKLSRRIYDVVVRLPLKANTRGDGWLPICYLDAIRSFLSGQGPSALFDLPRIPIYLAIIVSFHTVLGLTALIGAIVLGGLTVLTKLLTRRPMLAGTEAGAVRNGFAQAGQRNAEVLAAMGMVSRLGARWETANRAFMTSNRNVSDIAGGFGSVSRAMRMMLQSGVLVVGAFFVVHGQATGGSLSPVQSWWHGQWRRLILRLPIGGAWCLRARAGAGSTGCWH